MSTGSAAAISAGLDLAHWTTTDLWHATIGVGGGFSPAHVAELASGSRAAHRVEHDILAATLNDHFTDHGRNHPVPYWNQLPAD